MALASRIGVPVLALSSNEPGLIKFGNHRILGIQINSCFYLKNQLLEYLHSSGEKILRVRVSCAKYFCVEPYILHTRGNHLIASMARYRMSSHDLNIERGRYNNPITPINQRICIRCELNEIDDEIHLLLHCNAMNNERKILFNSVTTTINIQLTNEMFLQIMTSRDITVGRLGTFPSPLLSDEVGPFGGFQSC